MAFEFEQNSIQWKIIHNQIPKSLLLAMYAFPASFLKVGAQCIKPLDGRFGHIYRSAKSHLPHGTLQYAHVPTHALGLEKPKIHLPPGVLVKVNGYSRHCQSVPIYPIWALSVLVLLLSSKREKWFLSSNVQSEKAKVAEPPHTASPQSTRPQ